jgi:two-component system, OmpR family, response regulator RegX3
MQIGILEDDSSQMELLSHWLRLAGHQPRQFQAGAELVQALAHDKFDALLLDWNIPDINGIEVLKHVRGQLRSCIPVLFSTARAAEADVVHALNHGADDYLVKPLRRIELVARLEAVARRLIPDTVMHQPRNLEVDVFRAELQTRRILRRGRPVPLSTKDFDLAVLLLTNIGRLLSRAELLSKVWKTRGELNSRTLDTHVSRIRTRLMLTPENGWRLASVYRHGYRLERLRHASARTP